MIFITFLATLILSGHAGADDLSELRIGPETDVVRKIGDTFTLYCKTIEGITDVQWIGPDMEVIPLGSSPRRSVEKSGQDLLLDIRDLTREDDGVYRCKGLSTSTNKTIEASKQVSVYDPAEFVNPSEIQDFVIGETILVKCNATGNPVPTISWFREGQKIDTELNEKYFEEDGSTNLGIRNVSKDEEGMYRCKARQLSKGLSKDLDIQVNVNIPPKIENFTTEYTATAEETETFFCEATGDPEPQYSWYMGDGSGGDTFLTSESALKLFVTWDMNDRAYTCVAINAGGRDMATFTLTVQVKPNFTVEKGDSTREREAALLKCVADGVPTPVVHFYRDDLLIPTTALPETVDELALHSSSSHQGTNEIKQEILKKCKNLIVRFQKASTVSTFCLATSRNGVDSIAKFCCSCQYPNFTCCERTPAYTKFESSSKLSTFWTSSMLRRQWLLRISAEVRCDNWKSGNEGTKEQEICPPMGSKTAQVYSI